MGILKNLLTNKTIIANILTPVFAYLAAKGFALTPDQQGAVIAGALVIVNVVVEHFTSAGIATPTAATHFGA